MSTADSRLSADEEKVEEEKETQPMDEGQDTQASPSELEKQKPAAGDDEEKWISGPQLWLIMAGISLACFLMLLDVSILSTVCIRFGGASVAM